MRRVAIVAVLVALLAVFLPAANLYAEASSAPTSTSSTLYIPYVQMGRSAAWFTLAEFEQALAESGYPPDQWIMYSGMLLDPTSTPDNLHIATGYLATNRETGDMADGGVVYRYSISFQRVYWSPCPVGQFPGCIGLN